MSNFTNKSKTHKNRHMKNREIVNTLQTNLMKLAQAFVEKKDQNKPWGTIIEEFTRYHEQFKELIGKLPSDFYLDESNNEFTDDILKLSGEIESKVETLKNLK